MKRILKLDRLRRRGLSGAKDEVLLTATAQNLRRLAKLLCRGGRRLLRVGVASSFGTDALRPYFSHRESWTRARPKFTAEPDRQEQSSFATHLGVKRTLA
jgi:hypothetical protein